MEPVRAIERPTDVIRAAALLLALLAVAGCVAPATTISTAPAPPSSQDPIGLGVVNSTDLRVSLVVNSTLIETLSPHSGDVAIHMSALPPLPWVVEGRTSSGRVLATMTAGPGDVQGPAAIGVVHSGRQGGADLSCGQLYLWTGATEPNWPAPNESGSPGDCVP
jgi:hypothetical protein